MTDGVLDRGSRAWRRIRTGAAILVAAMLAVPLGATAASAAVPPGFTESIDLGAVRVGERGGWVSVRYASATATHVGSTVGIEISTAGGHSCDGTSCAVDVRFAPTSRGQYTGYVYFLTTEGEVIVPAVGVGLDTEVSLTPVSSSLGDVFVGSTSEPQTLTFANTGDFPVTVTGVQMLGMFERTGGTCTPPMSLPVGASCTIEVVFRPTAEVSVSATIAVTTAEGRTALATLSGTGLSTVPRLSLGPSVLTFTSTLVGSSSIGYPFTIANTGHVPVTLAGAVSTSSTEWVLGSTTCPEVLLPGATCRQEVVFAPTAPGDRAGTLRVETGATPATATLRGFGMVHAYALTPEEIDFGDVRLGASATRGVVVRNEGNVTMTIASVATTGPVSTTAADCAAPLPPDGTCTITLTYAPTAPGPLSGSLTVTSSFGPRTAVLRGVGATAGLDADEELDLGRVLAGTASGAGTVTVRNTGSVATTFAPATIDGPFEVAEDRCAGVVAAGGTCEVDVRFVPGPGDAGEQAGRLTIAADGAGGSASATVDLAGFAVLARLGVMPATLDFGVVALGRPTPPRTVTVSNEGNVPVVLDVADAVVDGLSVDASACAGVWLDPGETCELVAAFTPTAPGTVGATVTVTGTVDLTSGPHALDPADLALGGAGAIPALAADEERVDFGDVPVGSSQRRTVVITNDGPEVTITSVGAPDGFEVVDDGCTGAMLGTGESCEVVVRFVPTGVGETVGDLVVTADATGAPFSVTLRGVAPAATEPPVGVPTVGEPAVGELPLTGSPIGPALLGVAVLLMAAGAALVLTARRRAVAD